jgi:hypothetical protein
LFSHHIFKPCLCGRHTRNDYCHLVMKMTASKMRETLNRRALFPKKWAII